MPEEDDDLFDDDDEDLNDPDLVSKLRTKIKNQGKELKTLKPLAETGAESTRRLALLDAKLPDNPQVKFFLEHYKGEMTAEAIRAEAAQFGFIGADEGAKEEVDAIGNVATASIGATNGPKPGSDQEVLDEINAVPPGPNAAERVQQVLIKHGRFIPSEE
jgi:hypothetical protein